MTIRIDCVFRDDVRQDSAACALIQRISRSRAPIRVSEQACRLCGGGSIDEAIRANPVLPSLAFEACHQTLSEERNLPEYEQKRLQRLARLLEQDLIADSFEGARPRGTWSCDVICAVPTSSSISLAKQVDSIQSILRQAETRCVVHLVGDEKARLLAEKMGNPRQVIWHEVGKNLSMGAAMHQVIERLQTEYVAWHDIATIADSSRIREAVETLWRNGAEFWLAPVCWGEQSFACTKMDDLENSSLKISASIASLVCRRASLVDMRGLADRDDALVDLALRAKEQDRQFAFGTNESMSGPAEPATKSAKAQKAFGEPLGFQFESVACDIVLPFHNHFDYVSESLEAAVDQANADVTIHLVDDCSTEDTHALRQRWAQHPRVRYYRNRTNIGQFMSLNNVSKFCDTGLIAVQDADDISLPNRIETAGNFLRLCNADFFGGAVELFGSENLIRPVHTETESLEVIERAEQRHSFYPPATRIPYFLENPTAVFRREMFQQRGGYADFGTREMNRSSLDSEFLMRCFFSGVRFAITNEVMTRYRVHADSATQNRVTGWGTGPRAEASRLVLEHTRIFRQGTFDPRVFGSQGKYQAETIRT